MNSTIVRTLMLGLAASLVPGPLVVAQSKATRTSVESLNTVIKEMTKGRDEVQGALDALEALNKPGANLTKEYGRFTKNGEAMAKTKDQISSRADDMNSRRDASLDEWQQKTKSVTNPEVKAVMESRREQVKQLLDSSRPAREAARDAFVPFLSNLQDIDKLLSVDLSPAGIEAAASFTQGAVTHGKSVVAGLDAFLGSLTQVRDQLSPKRK